MRRLTDTRVLAYLLFWSWNITFLAFMLLGFGPVVLLDLVNSVRAGLIPLVFVVYGAVLILVPVLSVVLALRWLLNQPGKLFALLYGVEGPLMLVLLLLFFVFREITPAVGLLLAVTLAALATLLWQLLDPNIEERGLMLGALRTVGLTCLLAVGLYMCLWASFYAPPVTVALVEALWSWLINLPRMLVQFPSSAFGQVMLVVLGSILLVFTATLFVLTPLVVPVLYIRAWLGGVRALLARQRALAVALPVASLAVCAALLALAVRQPQRHAFELLEQPPASPEAAAALLEEEAPIRAGLLNAYLAPQRYLATVGGVTHISDLYRWNLRLPPESAAAVQGLYEVFARPMLYEPATDAPAAPADGSRRASGTELQRDMGRAAELYQQFFDQPINIGERDAVVRAARSTWSAEQAEGAWQAVDEREILLARQELTVTEHGDWADMELYEVYHNQTGERQEVVYYFSLPESAVITGVWLGNSADRSKRFVYQVAPRGAAQAVYRNEVRAARDPALVEQIGPRQYRLRVFPVEPRQIDWSNQSGRSPAGLRDMIEKPLHMWITWRVLAAEGQWPLPRLAEKRNVFWDGRSVRLVNGAPMQVEGDAWLPAALPAPAAAPAAHRVVFDDGTAVVVRPAGDADRPQLPEGLRLAVVLDRSRSMAKQVDGVRAALEQLRAYAGPAPLDLYLTASPYRGEGPALADLRQVDPAQILYYGGQNPAALLAQFGDLRGGRRYDAILVLTDSSGYELGPGARALAPPDAPVWMVHLGGLTLGYDDPTLEAIQASGGGVAGSLDEALLRLATAHAAAQPGGPADADLIDGYVWQLESGAAMQAGGPAQTVHAAGDPFAAFAARRLILDGMRRQRDALGNPAALDQLHALAIRHSIVTPFSSMIVLVNDAQQDLLDQLEQQDDRFEREHEQIGETPSVTGVPEPEEWLLLAVVAALLGWYWRTGRLNKMRNCTA
ncbi:MAG TPA: TIGR02921 family PEP-CTERM protein [Roseiflexaceae bacterium]|nr:TIGR02921 family PEP-CTERM protein [Roseiflexaceae bacterium]